MVELLEFKGPLVILIGKQSIKEGKNVISKFLVFGSLNSWETMVYEM